MFRQLLISGYSQLAINASGSGPDESVILDVCFNDNTGGEILNIYNISMLVNKVGE